MYLNVMKNLAERLVWARRELGETQAAVAKRAGIAVGTLANLETGLRNHVRKLTELSRALNVDPTWLAEGTGQPDAHKNHVAQAGGIAVVASDAVIIMQQHEIDIIKAWRAADADGRALIDSAVAVACRIITTPREQRRA